MLPNRKTIDVQNEEVTAHKSLSEKEGMWGEMGNKVLTSPYWSESRSPKALCTTVRSLYDAKSPIGRENLRS